MKVVVVPFADLVRGNLGGADLALADITATDARREVLDARSGTEALTVLRDHRDVVDLLFSDVAMPGGITGIELAEAAVQIRSDIKVLLTTGYADALVTSHAGESKFDILMKPYHRMDLEKRIHELFAEKG